MKIRWSRWGRKKYKESGNDKLHKLALVTIQWPFHWFSSINERKLTSAAGKKGYRDYRLGMERKYKYYKIIPWGFFIKDEATI